MHYSALNAVSAASPASASPSSSSLSSLSPVGHSHYHHLSSNEQQHSQASHHNSHSHDQLMASMSEGSSSISSSPYNTSGASSVTSTVIKTENMCDDLATYTTLQSSAPNTQQHYGNNDHHMTSSGQTAGPGNAAANTSSAGPKAGSKRSAPSSTTTATKSTYNGNSSSGGGNKSSGANSNGATPTGRTNPGGGKKTKGRVKIKMEFIDNKLRRYTTFSKRKTGIMKKAYELSTLTGTQVMLLVASETGHVYTFATRKLQPMITSDAGKALIQTCLNSPDPSGLMNGSAGSGSAASNTTGPDVVTTNGHVSTLVGGNNSGPVANSHSQLGQQQADGQHHNSDLSRMLSAGPGSLSGCSTPNTVEQRMSATGFEETELSYSVNGDDCSPLNEKGIFSGCLTIGTSSLVNSGPGTTSNSAASTPTVNGSLLRGKVTHQSAFFINETPGLGGQGSEEDDEEEEEDDEEEEPEEEDDDPELDMAYLAGLHGLDADLTRLIGSQTPSSQLDAMLSSALWAQPPPLPMGQPKQQSQSQNQQQPQSQPNSLANSNQTANSSGFVSDRTKLNLNLKLQQKQQMQRSQQAQQQSMRAVMGQGTVPRTAGQFALQPQQQNKTKGSTGQKSTKGSGVNKKNSSSTLRSTAAKSAAAVTSTSLQQSSATSSLGTSQQQQLSSAANSFVNFDPASFLDSCFNTCSSTGSPSPDSNSLLDAHHTLDQMLLANSGELLLLNQGMQNTNPNQTMSTEQQFNFMMMIGGGNNNNTVTSAPSLMNSQTTNFSNTAASKQATALKSSNSSRNTSARTSSSSSQLSNSFGSSIRTTVPQQQQVNFGQQLNNNSPSNFTSNLSGNCFLSSQKQQLSTAVTSATSTTNKQAVQSKAANLNAIINNLASASSNNSAAASSTSVSGVGASGHNTSASLNNSIDNSQNRGGLLGDQTAGAGGSGGGGLNQFGAMAAAAAQQLLSGNIILCTTPTSTLTLPNLDQSANNSNLNLPTSNTTTQLFSLSGGHSGTADSNNSSGPTTLLLPANLQASGLSIQPNSGNGPNGVQSSQQQLIYNAFSGLGRILYQAAPGQGQGMNQNRCDSNQGGSDGSQQQTFSTLITADGQQLILNVANASTNSIAQLVNTQANQAADNSRLRVKNQNLPENANTSPSISLLPGGQHSLVQHSTDHHLGQHSISLDSLLGPSLGPTPAPLITTFPSGQTLVTPVSTSTVVNGNLFGQPPKASPGSNLKKQRTK